MKILSIATNGNYSANCKLNYAVYLLQKTMNKITIAIFTIKILRKIKFWKLRFYHTRKNFDIVIFGQLTPEKPNVGKLVQQLRVLFIMQ